MSISLSSVILDVLEENLKDLEDHFIGQTIIKKLFSGAISFLREVFVLLEVSLYLLRGNGRPIVHIENIVYISPFYHGNGRMLVKTLKITKRLD